MTLASMGTGRWAPKSAVAGETGDPLVDGADAAGALVAVPFNGTTPVVSPALLWNSRAAMRSPSALGVNDTVAVQLAPMASVVRQVLVAIV